MGTITRSFANNITTSGVLLPASLTNNSIANVTAYNASVATGGMKLISSQTASNSASISFTTGIDSTYKEYQFWFVDIHPRSNSFEFQMNLSTDGGSNYNVTKTSTFFQSAHYESDSNAYLQYRTAYDLAQASTDNILTVEVSNASDASLVGFMQLFNPASTTYVKHYLVRVQYLGDGDFSQEDYTAGYGNTTSAVNAVRFRMATGNIDGTILMYGIV
jgi:hypothetical protein